LAQNYVYDPLADSWSTGYSMPTPRYGLTVATVNDLLYALGGGGYDYSDIYATNEQYTPIGYGTVSPTPSPTPSPSPTLSPLPTPSPSLTPTASPIITSSPTQRPTLPPDYTPTPSPAPSITASPTPTAENSNPNIILEISGVIAIAIVVVGLLVLFSKRRGKKQ